MFDDPSITLIAEARYPPVLRPGLTGLEDYAAGGGDTRVCRENNTRCGIVMFVGRVGGGLHPHGSGGTHYA